MVIISPIAWESHKNTYLPILLTFFFNLAFKLPEAVIKVKGFYREMASLHLEYNTCKYNNNRK